MNDVTNESTGDLRSICVYCGSADEVDPAYVAAAERFGRILAQAGLRLIYGGGSNGLMGALARAVIEHGGFVTGIIPEFLKNRELMLKSAQDLVVVPDMHTRKRLIFEHADAFVALPGGIGTLEELVEQLTWVQLERHAKPVLIADIGDFWRPLLSLFAHIREHRFTQPEFKVRYLIAERIDDILPMLQAGAKRRPVAVRERLDPRL
ncbi:MAG: TIGR00730 family Rossman fold protein [Beijerinckiaceae bacterium]